MNEVIHNREAEKISLPDDLQSLLNSPEESREHTNAIKTAIMQFAVSSEAASKLMEAFPPDLLAEAVCTLDQLTRIKQFFEHGNADEAVDEEPAPAAILMPKAVKSAPKPGAGRRQQAVTVSDPEFTNSPQDAAASVESEGVEIEELEYFGLDTLWGVEPPPVTETAAGPHISAEDLQKFYNELKSALQRPDIQTTIGSSQELGMLTQDLAELLEEKQSGGEGVSQDRELEEIGSSMLSIALLTKLHTPESNIQTTREELREIVANRLRVIDSVYDSLTSSYEDLEEGETKRKLYEILRGFESDYTALKRTEVAAGIEALSSDETEELLIFLTDFASLLTRTDENIEHGKSMLDKIDGAAETSQGQTEPVLPVAADDLDLGPTVTPTFEGDGVDSGGEERSEPASVSTPTVVENAEGLAEGPSLPAEFDLKQMVKNQFKDESMPAVRDLLDRVPQIEAEVQKFKDEYLLKRNDMLTTWSDVCKAGRDLNEAEETEYTAYKAARYAYIKNTLETVVPFIDEVKKTKGVKLWGGKNKKVLRENLRANLVGFTVVQDYEKRAQIKANSIDNNRFGSLLLWGRGKEADEKRTYMSLSRAAGIAVAMGAVAAPFITREYGADGIAGMEAEVAQGATEGSAFAAVLLLRFRRIFGRRRYQNTLRARMEDQFRPHWTQQWQKNPALLAQDKLDKAADTAELRLMKKINEPNSWGFLATNAIVTGAGAAAGAAAGAVFGRSALESAKDLFVGWVGETDPEVVEEVSKVVAEAAPSQAPAPEPRPVTEAPAPLPEIADAPEPEIKQLDGEQSFNIAAVDEASVTSPPINTAPDIPANTASAPVEVSLGEAPNVGELIKNDIPDRLNQFITPENVTGLTPELEQNLIKALLGDSGPEKAQQVYDALSAINGFAEAVPDLQEYINGLKK